MNKHKWFLVLITMSVISLIGSAAGCGTITPTAPAAKPTINSFTASPTSIIQGERTTLSWDVSGATTVTIEPAIGESGPSGSLQLTPDASVTYTLTAANQSGSATSSVSIAVAPVVAGKPDLVITDIWLTGSAINYKIANRGNAESKPSQSYFYIGYINQARQTANWLKQDTDWVDTLAPGEERITAFSNLDWRLQPNINPATSEITGHDIKACADAENSVAESNEGNNCLTEIWGPEFSYDFFKNAHLAEWRSDVGKLRWPMATIDDNGAVVRDNFSPILTICPEHVSNGWILGKFGDFYYQEETRQALVQDIEIPNLAQFTTKVGFAPGVTSTDGVRVALGYVDDMGSVVFFPKMDVNSDGQMHDYVVDLGDLAGKGTQFVLLVEAKNSPEGDCVRFLEPKIVQAAHPEM